MTPYVKIGTFSRDIRNFYQKFSKIGELVNIDLLALLLFDIAPRICCDIKCLPAFKSKIASHKYYLWRPQFGLLHLFNVAFWIFLSNVSRTSSRFKFWQLFKHLLMFSVCYTLFIFFICIQYIQILTDTPKQFGLYWTECGDTCHKLFLTCLSSDLFIFNLSEFPHQLHFFQDIFISIKQFLNHKFLRHDCVYELINKVYYIWYVLGDMSSIL